MIHSESWCDLTTASGPTPSLFLSKSLGSFLHEEVAFEYVRLSFESNHANYFPAEVVSISPPSHPMLDDRGSQMSERKSEVGVTDKREEI